MTDYALAPVARQYFETWLFHGSNIFAWEPESHAMKPTTYVYGLVLNQGRTLYPNLFLTLITCDGGREGRKERRII